MPSTPSNQRGSAQGGEHARAVRTGAISIDPATRLLIESNAEPRWGQFLRTWECLAAAKGRYPSRAEIDPAALGAKLLPNVFLTDVVNEPGRKQPRFRFRLLGQVIVDREPTRPGDYLDALGATGDVAPIVHHYQDCIAGQVWIREANLTWHGERRGYLRYKVMLLPLSDDGESVTQLIGLALYEF
jgi:hypothetical protein